MNWTKCTKDKSLIWNAQKFILRLNVKVKEKKTQWLFLFCICLYGCLTLRHFSLEYQVDMQKESWLSPLALRVLYLFLDL